MPDIPDNATLSVRRFELYPDDNPNRYVVGISLELPNGRETYREQGVPLTDAESMSQEEIRDEAIQESRDALEAWAAQHAEAPAFVGGEESWSDVEQRLIPQWEVGLFWGTQAEYDAHDGSEEYGGRKARYDGTVYQTIDGQGHVAQSPDWTPPSTPALWEVEA
jgi:hypothetical protein